MASPAMRDNNITLRAGVPETLAFRFIEGKNLGDSKFPPFLPRVVFSTVDGRSLFLDSEDASDLERGMRELGIDPAQGDVARITLVKHPRGGGHSLRVERADGPPARLSRPAESEDPRTVALLERSLEMARNREASAPRQTPAAPSHQQTNNGPIPERPMTNVPTKEPGTFAKLLSGALCAAIDGYAIAGAYAEAKGVAFDYSVEDIRCSSTTLLIEWFKREGARS